MSAFTRGEHRQPAYGNQVRRDRRRGAYIVGFVVVVVALAAFLYVALSWATGPGRATALPVQPTLTPVAELGTAPVEPSPTIVGEQTYLVQTGDYPEKIAQKFGIKTDELIAANNIQDPQKLQIGQVLKIPPPTSGR